MALTTSLLARIRAAYTGSGDHGTPRADTELAHEAELASGVGASQADKVFSDQRTLNASASEDLDLAGVLTDAFGATLTFAKVKAILIKAASGNTNSVIVGAASGNQFQGPFGAVTHTLSIPPGGSIMLTAPVSGWTVTAGTGDLLKIANSAGGSSVTYDITIIGTSA